MAVDFNPKRYDDPFISDLVGFVAADEFQVGKKRIIKKKGFVKIPNWFLGDV